MRWFVWCGICVAVLSWTAVEGATYHAYPGASLQSAIGALGYGDTLIVHSVGGNGTGRYGHFKVYGKIGDDPGTPEKEWVTVKAADGEPRPVIYEPAYNQYNLVELRNTIRYFKFQGLEFDSGSDSIKLPGTNGDHIVFEDLYMHNIGNTGINLSSCGDIGFMEIRGCEIHDTGYAGNGEGMYLGTHDYQGTGAGILHDSIIEWNHVYDCAGSDGDGIEMKYECYRNIIRDNVVHDTGYPGILCYGTARPGAADNNIVLRNAVWNSGDWAITAFQTTTIMNNVVFNSPRGIHVGDRASQSVGDHDGSCRDVYIYNNTVYSSTGLTSWLVRFYVSGKPNIEICNNLFYQPNASWYSVYFDGASPGLIATNNYYYGDTQNLPSGFTFGPAPASAFVSASTTPGVIDLYLQSGTALDGAASAAYAPDDDFNGVARPRGGADEPGAYEILGADNPGWPIDEQFKWSWRFGDCDHDGDVDLDDYVLFEAEMTGPGGGVSDVEFDADDDGDCDMADYAVMAANLAGGS